MQVCLVFFLLRLPKVLVFGWRVFFDSHEPSIWNLRKEKEIIKLFMKKKL